MRSTLPRFRFISLFVPNLAEATSRYASLLQMAPSEGTGGAPSPHPFATKGPVVFQLGDLALALYECDGHTTHPGDVGLGIESNVEQTAVRLRQQGGMVFWGPATITGSETELAIGMMPDRHFFEIVEPSG